MDHCSHERAYLTGKQAARASASVTSRRSFDLSTADPVSRPCRGFVIVLISEKRNNEVQVTFRFTGFRRHARRTLF